MQGIKILVADDESRMRKLIHDYLMKEGYEVLEAEDGVQALDLFYQEREIVLVILDVMMPGADGWTVLREIRKESSVPVIMLTAKSEEEDELMGFDLGADEYVKKPFSIKALGARVRAIIQRTNPTAAMERLEEGGIVLDKSAHEVRINGNPVELSFKEFELLQYFMENEGIALSREKILNNVWNYDYYGDARTIDTHVKKLRAKLGEAGALIQTVWGYGYKFDA